MTGQQTVYIYTDGACRGNPGPGGWGAILQYSNKELTLNGAQAQTTNNRMELTAAIEALKALKRPCKVVLTTDSKYLLDGITKWLYNWRANQWRNSQKKPVKNADLWQILDQLIVTHEIEWCWVKGHSGHELNERADLLANQAIDHLLE